MILLLLRADRCYSLNQRGVLGEDELSTSQRTKYGPSNVLLVYLYGDVRAACCRRLILVQLCEMCVPFCPVAFGKPVPQLLDL